MKTKSFTYRLFSALMLILFMSSIVLPSGISAASLFCDMPMTELHTDSNNCCEVDEITKSDQHRKNSAGENCHSEKICLHIISPDHSETEATISHNGKKITDLPVTQEEMNFPVIREHTDLSNNFTEVLKYSLPIFLMNSTFLN